MLEFFKSTLHTLFSPIWTVLHDPKKIFVAPGKVLGLSLPARVAVFLAIFLIIGLIVVGVLVLRDPHRGSEWFYRGWVLAPLVAIIPVLFYQALRLWLEGDISAYADIDRAWNQGLAALARQNLNIEDLPVFVVLGSGGEDAEAPLFEAAGQSFSLKAYPEGQAALQWYANPKGIYLVLTRVGALSKLASSARDKFEKIRYAMPGQGGANALRATDIRGTMAGGDSASGLRMTGFNSPLAAPAANLRGTMTGEDSSSSRAAPPAPVANLRGTMVAGAETGKTASEDLFKLALDAKEQNLQASRIRHLARLLRQRRRPFCPANGVLTLLPSMLVAWNHPPRELHCVSDAVRRDLDALTDGLQLRCPVIALVTGMEQEPGFNELVSRLGPETAKGARFGKGLDFWCASTTEQLYAVSEHACHAFEQFVYSLFRRDDSLSQDGNKKLFGLMCKVRRVLEPRLQTIMCDGFGYDAEEAAHRTPVLFGGCYFAATGSMSKQQAYVASVLSRLTENETEIAWTPAARAQDRRHRTVTKIMLALSVALTAALGYSLWIVFR